MSKQVFTELKSNRFYLLVMAFWVLGAFGKIGVMEARASCRDATLLQLGSTYRGQIAEPGQASCFTLHIPAAGQTLVAVTAPRGTSGEARLGVSGSCDGFADLSRARIHADTLLLQTAEARSLLICVGGRDPRQTLGAFKLSSSFVDDESPRGLIRTPEPIEVDPDPKAPLRPTDWVALCESLGESDDHGEAFPCSSLLLGDGDPAEVIVEGELANGQGDDIDIFHIEMGHAGILYLDAVAEVGIAAELHDAKGRFVASGREVDGEFSLSRWLESGLYFLRLTGVRGAEGAYAIRASSSRSSW